MVKTSEYDTIIVHHCPKHTYLHIIIHHCLKHTHLQHVGGIVQDGADLSTHHHVPQGHDQAAQGCLTRSATSKQVPKLDASAKTGWYVLHSVRLTLCIRMGENISIRSRRERTIMHMSNKTDIQEPLFQALQAAPLGLQKFSSIEGAMVRPGQGQT